MDRESETPERVPQGGSTVGVSAPENTSPTPVINGGSMVAISIQVVSMPSPSGATKVTLKPEPSICQLTKNAAVYEDTYHWIKVVSAH